MKTLLKILQEKMLLIEQLESQLIEQKQKTEESTKTMLYWYERHNALTEGKNEERHNDLTTATNV